MGDRTTDVKTSLYRLFDESDVLLYVGVTGNLGRRLAQHAVDKAWWEAVATITVKRYPSRDMALAYEAQAILEERPRFNTHHKGAPRFGLVVCATCLMRADDGVVCVDVRQLEVAGEATLEVRCALCIMRFGGGEVGFPVCYLTDPDMRQRILRQAAAEPWAKFTNIVEFARKLRVEVAP
jgi:hypothetical protein